MPAPRLDINLEKIYQNAHELVTQLANFGISVTGVTKSTVGSVEVATTLLQAGVSALGDSRIQNIKAMRLRGKGSLVQHVPMTLIRSPMLSEIEQVVMYADVSCNTEVEVIKRLSNEAKRQGRTHQIILMLELGDLREGIMPDDLIDVVREVHGLPNILIKGIGTNLACRSGVSPDAKNMAELSRLTNRIEAIFDLRIETVTGGNSANLQWALDATGTGAGRINNLRIGEAILLGRETLNRLPIDGLHTDAITFTAEVIESKLKSSQPTGEIAQSAFGEPAPERNPGTVRQGILAVGIQDVDPSGLQAPGRTQILGASSDHLIVESPRNELFVGQEIVFQINYSALLRAMTSPFVSKVYADRKVDLSSPPQAAGIQS